LKELTIKAGVHATGTLLLLTDAQIFDESFLVPLNEWLSTGQTPASFFSAEERDTVIHNIRNRVKLSLKIQDPTSGTCWQFFHNEVARHLHLVFSFSPLDPKYRIRAQRFPAIFS